MLWFSYEVSSKTKRPNFFRYLTLLCAWRFTNCSIIGDQCMILWKLAFLFAFRLKCIHEVITSWINCIYLINIIRFVNIGPLYATHHLYIKIIDRHCALSIFLWINKTNLVLDCRKRKRWIAKNRWISYDGLHKKTLDSLWNCKSAYIVESLLLYFLQPYWSHFSIDTSIVGSANNAINDCGIFLMMWWLIERI